MSKDHRVRWPLIDPNVSGRIVARAVARLGLTRSAVQVAFCRLHPSIGHVGLCAYIPGRICRGLYSGTAG